jgi:hypothetical protein
MEHEAISALWFSVGLAVAVVAYRQIFLPAMVSGFRQDVFEIRRDLFLIMSRGGIGADHQAYERMREMLNGLLRFAERVTFLRLVAMMVAWIRAGRPVSSYQAYEDSIQDPEVRATFAGINNRIGRLVMLHSIITSPLAWAAIVLLIFGLVLLWIARGGPLQGTFRRVSRRAEALAEELTSDDGHCAA